MGVCHLYPCGNRARGEDFRDVSHPYLLTLVSMSQHISAMWPDSGEKNKPVSTSDGEQMTSKVRTDPYCIMQDGLRC